MKVVDEFGQARLASQGLLGLVPTMGALHEGHLSLIEAARKLCDTLMVSIFVNPLQFNDPADLSRYPRPFEADLELCRLAGVDLVFAPTEAVMYPQPQLATVKVDKVGARMEGSHRPGHLDGVATVVAKLFAGLRPDLAWFGRKDAQQLALIRRMTADLNFPVEVIGSPTVRTAEGLAMSSRNALMSAGDRKRALLLGRGLMSAADAVEAGERDGEAIERIARSKMTWLDVEYVELAAQHDAARLSSLDQPSFLAAAVRVGDVRLIDNVAFDIADGVLVADRGRRVAS